MLINGITVPELGSTFPLEQWLNGECMHGEQTVSTCYKIEFGERLWTENDEQTQSANKVANASAKWRHGEWYVNTM